MFVFISFGVWVVAFGDGMGGVSSPPPVPRLRLGTGGYLDVRPLGEIIEGAIFRATSSRRSLGMLLIRWGLVGVEPVGGSAVAGGEAHATVVGILHLGNDDVLHLRQFARHHVEVQLVVHLQNHA